MLTYHGLRLKLREDVYEPAEDTFLLAENLVVRPGDVALDVGTGTGIIAMMMAEKARWVLGVDVNPSAVELARENAALNGIGNVDFRLSDLFEDVEGRFDVITFNAPYLPGEPEEGIDRALVGGRGGREVIDRFIREVACYVRPSGMVQLVQSSITGVKETLDRFRLYGFKPKIAAKLHVFFEDVVLINALHVADSYVFKTPVDRPLGGSNDGRSRLGSKHA